MCVPVYVYMFAVLFQVFVRNGVHISAGDRREERYHPSSPCSVFVCVWVKEEVRADFLRSTDTQRCFDILYGVVEGEGGRPVCVCGCASV